MIEAGTDIFRLNCSHRRGGDFERVYPLIRKTAKELGKKAHGVCLRLRRRPFAVGWTVTVLHRLSASAISRVRSSVLESWLEIQSSS